MTHAFSTALRPRPTRGVLRRYREQGSHPVGVEPRALSRLGLRSVEADLLGPGEWIRHDPLEVARGLIRLSREWPLR